MTDERFAVSYEIYRRPFRQPLVTSHGVWAVREGAIVTLQSSDGRMGQGEIAPLEWFGSESLAEAIAFCAGLNGVITREAIFAISDRLPCCQFAFETALELDLATNDLANPATIAALLPTGQAAIMAWRSLYAKGSRTFKWKIGVAPIANEMAWFQDLYQQLPADCKLRLDANAGLDFAQAERWLNCFVDYPIEYLEQPLDIHSFEKMKILHETFGTTLALDESISNLASLINCDEQGWRGVYVIKPAIVGSPLRLRQFLRGRSIDVVFSSVFETVVGFDAGLRLGLALQRELGCDRALGYGTGFHFT